MMARKARASISWMRALSAAVERDEIPHVSVVASFTNTFIANLPKINQSLHQSGLLFTGNISQAK
jgi:hypothetical protein